MEKASTSNAFRMDQLYNDILNDYQVRLQKQEKEGRIPPNKSEDIIKRTKEILKDYGYLLKTSYRNLLKQQELEKEQKNNRELEEQQNALNIQKQQQKIEQQIIEDEFQFMEKEDAKKNEKLAREVNEEKQEQDIVKKEENVSEEEEESDGNNEFQETKKLRKFVLANLDACFEGVFISSRKKYIAKTERTRFDLENVFVKLKDREILYKMVSCDLTTVKTEEVKINYS